MPTNEKLSIFHIFAARATAELVRRQAERELDDSRQREHRLRAERQRIEAEVAYLREELRSRSDFSEIVGESDGIWKVLRNIDMVAPTDSTVLILGETGHWKRTRCPSDPQEQQTEATGHSCESIARHFPIHSWRVNCSVMNMGPSLERPNRERGALNWPMAERSFLDEIGEMPLASPVSFAPSLAGTGART